MAVSSSPRFLPSTASATSPNIASTLREAFETGLSLPLEWRMKQVSALLRMLNECEDDLAQALFSDLGKSPHECFFSEIIYLKHSCRYAMRNLKKWMAPQKVYTPLVTFPTKAEVMSEPLGVILIIAPWNFPLSLALDPLLGAIAAGNAVVVKPSEVAQATSALLAKLLPAYLDSRVVRVVEGGVEECTILLEQKWDKIFFTGSSAVGKIVMAAATKYLTPITLELGGKCPVLVDSTTDLDVTARRVVFAKWNTSYGQACIAPDYVLVEASVTQKLIKKIKSTITEYYGENATSSQDHGRVVNRRHLERLRSYLEEDMVAECIVEGGNIDEAKLNMDPTILLNPSQDSLVMKEEIFGPILPIIEVEHIDEGIEYIKARPKPIAIYVFTGSNDVKQKAVKMQAGSVVFNDAVVQFVLDGFPFGGFGESGSGSYHGKYSFDMFSHPKAVLYRTFWLDLKLRYPPFTNSKRRLARRLMEFDYVGALLVLLGLRA